MFNSYLTNTLEYDATKCINCGMCYTVCPHGVFAPDDKNGDKKAVLVNPAACMECGACQLNCPAEAIRVESGVGCAAAMITSALRGRKEVTCDHCGCGSSDKEKPSEESTCSCSGGNN